MHVKDFILSTTHFQVINKINGNKNGLFPHHCRHVDGLPSLRQLCSSCLCVLPDVLPPLTQFQCAGF